MRNLPHPYTVETWYHATHDFRNREAQSRFQEKEQELSNRIDALQQEQRRLEDRSVEAFARPRKSFRDACVKRVDAERFYSGVC